EGDRANPATDLRVFTTGNLVQPLIDGRSYFARLCAELSATEPGDQVYFLDFRGDLDERLDGPGSEIGEDGGQVLLDARPRRGGSHHQKLVVVRRPGYPARDVAFIGGIDLGHSR